MMQNTDRTPAMDPLDYADYIAKSAPGTRLIVCDTIAAVPDAGGVINLPIGATVRVKFYCGVMWCETAIDGRAVAVTFQRDQFHALERCA
ncbi:hypothetical protein [Maricaulis sp.]|uniref:hypothetical protein n=1 Tax=Maricaulis sp. TaxID=1486257 RepID=UPI003A94934C